VIAARLRYHGRGAARALVTKAKPTNAGEKASRIRVGSVGDLAPGEGRVVDAGPHTVAIFNVEGRYVALDNRCPHRGGPLGEGDLDGAIVTCPWHAWRWDVTTGANANNPAVRVACFPVTIEGDAVFVEIVG